MIARLILMLLICCSAAPLLPAAQDFEYGPRPESGVFDPAGLLDDATRKEISKSLTGGLAREGVDVIVVVLADIGDAPPELVARRFAAAWSSAGIHAVVLHVPGHAQSPWILPGGEFLAAIQPGKVRITVAEATARAFCEPTDAGKVRAASVEAADMLRYWMGSVVNRSESLLTELTRQRIELETKARQRRILKLMAVASALPLTLALYLVFLYLRKPGPRRFPESLPQRRLGAPFSGGSHLVVDIGQPRK